MNQKKILLHICTIGFALLAFSGRCYAQREKIFIGRSTGGHPGTRMLGGHFSSTLSRGPFALVEVSFGDEGIECSGILIGPKEVLTAAHCVANEHGDPPFSAGEYTVTVGGHDHSVSAVFYNSLYDPDAPVNDASSRNDLGMLILSSNVTGTSPLPVVTDDPPVVGEEDTLYGYGTNATSSDSNFNDLADGKFGTIKVSRVQNGIFDARYLPGLAISCDGDSGGAIVRGSGGSAGVLGVVSSGTTGDSRGGACIGTVGDESDTYVNLQNSSSVAFLSMFNEVRYAPGKLLRLKGGVDALIVSVKAAQKLQDLPQIKTDASAFNRKLATLASFVNAPRQEAYTGAKAALVKIKIAKKLANALKLLKTALQDLRSISAQGVQ